MTDEHPEEQDERAWQADKRDFVAERRDELADQREQEADEREARADERDHLADEREALADVRERALDDRTGSPDEVRDEAGRRIEDHAGRQSARRDRDDASTQRSRQSAERREAAERRSRAEAERVPKPSLTGLARRFANIAGELLVPGPLSAVLSRTCHLALSTIDGCTSASITTEDVDGALRTAATTDERATAVDMLQYEAGEGPCVDALRQTVVYAPYFPDGRWPALADHPNEHGVQSTLSYSLLMRESTLAALHASLNSYGADRDAFSTEAQEIGFILASHASIAAEVGRSHDEIRQRDTEFHEALLSRDIIGQAKGILMERMQLTAEDAFDHLRRSSQHLNHKLREVAARLAHTGEFDDDEGNAPRPSERPRAN